MAPRKNAPFVWSGDWSDLPPSLTAHHMAAILGVGVDCIWDRCQRRTMRPRPIQWMRPLNWRENNPVMKKWDALPLEIRREFAALLCADLGLTAADAEQTRVLSDFARLLKAVG